MKRFEVYLVKFDPSIGSEISKTRPAIILSPNEMNSALQTIIIAPLTSTLKDWPFRISTVFNEIEGQIALDQLKSISKERVVKKLGSIDEKTSQKCIDLLVEMFLN